MIQFWAILAILVHLVHTAFVTVSMHPSFDLGLKQLDKSPIWSYAGKSQSMLLSCRRRNGEVTEDWRNVFFVKHLSRAECFAFVTPLLSFSYCLESYSDLAKIQGNLI